MKIIYIVSISLICFTVSCKRDCADNLSVFYKKIPYKNGDIITFYNDTLGERKDTILINHLYFYGDTYHTGSGYDGNDECTARLYVKYSNTYYYEFYQYDNYSDNHVEYTLMIADCISKDTLLIKNSDTIHAFFLHLDRVYIDSLYGHHPVEFHKSPDGSILYNDFIVVDSPYYKLVEYTTLDTFGNKRKWRIQE